MREDDTHCELKGSTGVKLRRWRWRPRSRDSPTWFHGCWWAVGEGGASGHDLRRSWVATEMRSAIIAHQSAAIPGSHTALAEAVAVVFVGRGLRRA